MNPELHYQIGKARTAVESGQPGLMVVPAPSHVPLRERFGPDQRTDDRLKHPGESPCASTGAPQSRRSTVQTEWLTPRQNEIVDFARELVVTEGAGALSMGRLARELGVDLASLRKQFSGTDELLVWLAVDALFEQSQALRSAGGDLPAQLASYRKFALEQPELYRLITERPIPETPLLAALRRRVTDALGHALGPELASAMWAFAHGMVELELDQRFTSQADSDRAWQAGVAALAAAAQPARIPDCPQLDRSRSASSGSSRTSGTD
jgi:AcrR family transcriptional regulator